MRSGRACARRPWLLLAAVATILLVPARFAARADDLAAIPEPAGFVNDRAEIMDESSRAKLEAFLDQVQKKTGAQFSVLTLPTTEPEDPREFKVRVFQTWKIGKGGKDDGLLLLVAMKEHAAWFETGYGLEGTLPDAFEARVVRERLVPRFREQDYAGGITAAMIACATRLAKEQGVTLEWDGRPLRYASPSTRELPGWAVAIIFLFVVIMIISFNASGGGRGGRWRRRGYGTWLGPGGWGGGFGGGFGSFGGGGGGGSSWGGFGGGSSGGGGGGGNW